MTPSYPCKRISAGGIIRNADGHLLVVKPAYRKGWLLPGGIVEPNESPAKGLIREVKEEVGLNCGISRLVCVDHVQTALNYGESIHFLFECMNWSIDQGLAPAVKDPELLDVRFMPHEQALVHLVPTIAARLQTCKRSAGKTLYLEDGQIAF